MHRGSIAEQASQLASAHFTTENFTHCILVFTLFLFTLLPRDISPFGPGTYLGTQVTRCPRVPAFSSLLASTHMSENS